MWIIRTATKIYMYSIHVFNSILRKKEYSLFLLSEPKYFIAFGLLCFAQQKHLMYGILFESRLKKLIKWRVWYFGICITHYLEEYFEHYRRSLLFDSRLHYNIWLYYSLAIGSILKLMEITLCNATRVGS